MKDTGNNKPGYVYVLWAMGTPWYKVGHSDHPIRREKQIKLKQPYDILPITIIVTNDMLGVESYLHDWLGDCREQGEWFRLSKDHIEMLSSIVMVDTVRELRQVMEIPF